MHIFARTGTDFVVVVGVGGGGGEGRFEPYNSDPLSQNPGSAPAEWIVCLGSLF